MYSFAKQQFNYNDVVVDLHDIALLLTYERGTTESRFRHAKLREVATGLSDFQTIMVPDLPEWSEATVPRTGYVFEKPNRRLSKEEQEEPDLPSNMLLTPVHPSLRDLTPKQLETYYWQPRNHDGCYRTVALFQHFIDLFPNDLTRIRVRVVENKVGRTYTTLSSDRMIIEMKLFEPKSMNMTTIRPANQLHLTGSDDVMDHAVLAFPHPTESDKADVILDLASLQFGDVGRGFKGRGLFVLESVEQYKARLNTIADENEFPHNVTVRIRNVPPDDDGFLRSVAERAKARWDNRATDPWCGHCGAPARQSPLLRCSKCHAAHYCNAEHQVAAWTFHKHFCVAPSVSQSPASSSPTAHPTA